MPTTSSRRSSRCCDRAVEMFRLAAFLRNALAGSARFAETRLNEEQDRGGPMHVLALNPGSATLKFRLYALGDPEDVLASGTVDHVVGETTTAAAEAVIEQCRPLGVEAVGCRVVHGGERFT